MMMAPTRVLVTDAGGFIGQHLVKRLKRPTLSSACTRPGAGRRTRT